MPTGKRVQHEKSEADVSRSEHAREEEEEDLQEVQQSPLHQQRYRVPQRTFHESYEGTFEEAPYTEEDQPGPSSRQRHVSFQDVQLKDEETQPSAHLRALEDIDEEDDDAPPLLEPEEGPNPEELLVHENIAREAQMMEYDEGDLIRVQSPGGTQQYLLAGDVAGEMYVDGEVMQMLDETGAAVSSIGAHPATSGGDLRTVEFNFLDNKHICCGLCGEIVPYDLLLTEHLPTHHPDVFGEGNMDLEEIPYDQWLKAKLVHEKKLMENGFRNLGGFSDGVSPGTHHGSRMYSSSTVSRSTRVLRKVSQIRVNPQSMTLAQLDIALKKKMIEKMGRKVKVSLVDKQHARCGICNAVVSLNKKFEVIHLVRHFNAWHPSTHRCAGSWPNRANLMGPGKPLSMQDFAVVDVAVEAPENLQCIWCGMFMDRNALAMHFHEVHPDEIEVPKCHLCLQELVINARLIEKFGEDFEVVLPDEHHLRCIKLDQTFNNESSLDRNIERRIRRMQAAETGEASHEEEDLGEEDNENEDHARDPAYTNSRMSFGRRNKPKRNFIMPYLRQAAPSDSRFVEFVNDSQWRCKLCHADILAAVISAGAIKHFRMHHPQQLEEMQYELCKTRLERVSDGCMEFVHPELIECLICNMTYALHKPYNMCRGIRHLKTKHPEMMPEYTGHPTQTSAVTHRFKRFDDDGGQGVPGRSLHRRTAAASAVDGSFQFGDIISDPAILEKLKAEFNVEFDKMQTIIGADGEPIYLLMPEGEAIDEHIAENIQSNLGGSSIYVVEQEAGATYVPKTEGATHSERDGRELDRGMGDEERENREADGRMEEEERDGRESDRGMEEGVAREAEEMQEEIVIDSALGHAQQDQAEVEGDETEVAEYLEDGTEIVFEEEEVVHEEDIHHPEYSVHEEEPPL